MKAVRKSSYTRREDQIEIARSYAETYRQMQKDIMALQAVLNMLDFDSDIEEALQGLYDNTSHITSTIDSALHDACIDTFKTDEEAADEASNANEERDYRNYVRAVYNENKI